MKTRLLLFAMLFCISTSSFGTVFMVNVQDFSFTPSSFTMHVGDTVMWMWVNGTHTTTSTSVPAGVATWNSNITSATIMFMYTPTVAGTYNYNCSVHPSIMTASFTVVGVTSVPTIAGAQGFNVFPNPAMGSLHLQFGTTNAPISVTLMDISGRQVTTQQYANTADASLDIKDIPNGTYFISANQGGQIYKQQVIIAH